MTSTRVAINQISKPQNNAGIYLHCNRFLRRNYNCSASENGTALWTRLSSADQPSKSDCASLQHECQVQPPPLTTNVTCDDSCYDFCWVTDVGALTNADTRTHSRARLLHTPAHTRTYLHSRTHLYTHPRTRTNLPPARGPRSHASAVCVHCCVFLHDTGDCADFDDENSFCVSMCQEYCLASHCGSRELRPCELECGELFMEETAAVDFVQFSLCIAANCSTVPISPY